MANQVLLHAVIHGLVQGVFFRAFIVEKAKELGLTGYTRNLPSGQDVEVEAEGDREKLERLIEHLKIGPPFATVDNVLISWAKQAHKYSNFSIRN